MAMNDDDSNVWYDDKNAWRENFVAYGDVTTHM